MDCFHSYIYMYVYIIHWIYTHTHSFYMESNMVNTKLSIRKRKIQFLHEIYSVKKNQKNAFCIYFVVNINRKSVQHLNLKQLFIIIEKEREDWCNTIFLYIKRFAVWLIVPLWESCEGGETLFLKDFFGVYSFHF